MLLGDLIYALPGVKKVSEKYNKKAIIYLGLNQEWPMNDAIKRRGGITMTEVDLELIRPLLLRQNYIEDVLPAPRGEKFHAINLDHIMSTGYAESINIPYGFIPRWYFMVWPEMTCDLSKPWLHVEERVKLFAKKPIIISRSARLHNRSITYKFLQKYQNRILFVGLPDEHKDFCRCFFDVPHYEVENFLHLAIAINSCKFFIGNQSFPYSIAEGMKIPRILEMSHQLPNVIPTGEHAYDFVFQYAFEFYVDKLMSEL